MSVNLSKNGAALMAAYKEVVDGKSNTDWWDKVHPCVCPHLNLLHTHTCLSVSGRCSPTKETPTTSEWHRKEVSVWIQTFDPSEFISCGFPLTSCFIFKVTSSVLCCPSSLTLLSAGFLLCLDLGRCLRCSCTPPCFLTSVWPFSAVLQSVPLTAALQHFTCVNPKTS